MGVSNKLKEKPKNKKLLIYTASIAVVILLASISIAIAYAGGFIPKNSGHQQYETEIKDYEDKPADNDFESSEKAVIQNLPYNKTLDSIGTVKAKKETQLSTKASGRLHTLNVNVGDTVGQGYLVAQISGEEQYAQLASAKTSLDNSNSQYENTKNLMDQQVSTSQTQVDTARAGLQVLQTNRENLDETSAQQIKVAEKQVELAQIAYDSAPTEEKEAKQKQLDIAQQQLEELKTNINSQKEQLDKQINVAEEQVDQAEAQVRSTERQRDVNITNVETQKDSTKDSVTLAQIMVNNTMVHAPFYGVVVKKHGEIGQFVQAGQPVVTIADTNFLIRTEIADSDIEKVQIGQSAEVEIDGLNQTFQTTVNRIYPTVDERTRTFKVELQFTQPPENLKYGQSAQVKIFQENQTAYFLPEKYVYPSFDGPYIVFEDGEKQFVETGVEHNGMIEIYYYGITEGIKTQ